MEQRRTITHIVNSSKVDIQTYTRPDVYSIIVVKLLLLRYSWQSKHKHRLLQNCQESTKQSVSSSSYFLLNFLTNLRNSKSICSFAVFFLTFETNIPKSHSLENTYGSNLSVCQWEMSAYGRELCNRLKNIKTIYVKHFYDGI